MQKIILLIFFLFGYAFDCSANINGDFYKKENIYMKLPLLFTQYDDVLLAYPGAKYLYPGSFAIDKNNNLYVQYIFEPKQSDNILVCYSNAGVYKGFYKIPSGGRGGGGEGIALEWNEFNTQILFVVSNHGVLQEYNMDSRFYGDRLLKEREFFINAFNQFSKKINFGL